MKLGIVQHSYTESWRPNSGAKFHNALTFLEYSASIGAAGVQTAIKPDEHADAPKIRAVCEKLGAYFEGNVGLPKTDSDLAAFEANLKAAATAGATIVRTACLSGRRYETFKSLQEFRDFRKTSEKFLAAAEPLLKKHNLKLAFENHKDWLIAEQIEIVKKISSDRIGLTVDTGNSISLLEDPYEVVEAMAPFAFSSHLKDMAVAEYENGFLLSEVILGRGFLDIRRMVTALQKSNPNIRLVLEMITRDPLQIPCLTDKYYAPFENRPATQLARTLAMVKAHPGADLPKTTGLTSAQRVQFEDQNVRACLAWANTNL
jgi:3-oxoisoapionate decarboxylase